MANTPSLRFWIVAAAVLVAAAFLAYFLWTSVVGQPPESTLTYEGSSVAGVVGSYCNYSGCTDRALTLPDQSLRANSGDVLVFDYGGWSVGEVDVRAFPVNRANQSDYPERAQHLTVNDGPSDAMIHLELSSGEYLVEILLNNFSSSASYYFHVNVRG